MNPIKYGVIRGMENICQKLGVSKKWADRFGMGELMIFH